ncbi:Hypothetical protein CINCED_3A022719 [Cinara cedri]|uniref:Uncharacterized protein n=1 Tax=Cinara cedri TaxID=506608 RepID=A0A5E4LZ08_9HEMI|nr:Hypothetical protein CINCED_3A022719 [Cinara cedri]
MVITASVTPLEENGYAQRKNKLRPKPRSRESVGITSRSVLGGLLERPGELFYPPVLLDFTGLFVALDISRSCNMHKLWLVGLVLALPHRGRIRREIETTGSPRCRPQTRAVAGAVRSGLWFRSVRG